MGRIAVTGKNNPAYKHGHTESKFSPEYHTWSGMIQRCTNKNRKMWKYYGGKGVTVCDRWLNNFEDFLADMGPRPEGMTLDRVEGHKGYYLENCRWATASTQASNKVKKTEGYAQDILCLVMLGRGYLPDIIECLNLHPEVVKKEVRKLRTMGVIKTTAVAPFIGSTGRTLQCTYNGRYDGDK